MLLHWGLPLKWPPQSGMHRRQSSTGCNQVARIKIEGGTMGVVCIPKTLLLLPSCRNMLYADIMAQISPGTPTRLGLAPTVQSRANPVRSTG